MHSYAGVVYNYTIDNQFVELFVIFVIFKGDDSQIN